MSGPSRYSKSSRTSHPYNRGNEENGGSAKKTPAIGKDEANELERPCRRLFVRNCNFDVREDEIKELFTAYGEIKNFCDLISRRGICFLTFYDLRGAERARTALNGSNLRGRSINIHYSLPKEDVKRSGRCDREKDQGSLYVTLRKSRGPLDNQSLRSFFERYGQVMNIRNTNDPLRKVIEYYDSRDCEAAFDGVSENPSFMDGHLEVEFTWDEFERLIERERSDYRGDRRETSNNASESDLNALLQNRIQSLKASQSSGNWQQQQPMYASGGVPNTTNLLSMLQQHPMPSGAMPSYPSYGYSSYQGSMANSPGMHQQSYSMPTMPSMTMPTMMGSLSGLPTGQLPTGSVAPAGAVPGGNRAPPQTKLPTTAPGSTLTPQQIQQLLSLLPSTNQIVLLYKLFKNAPSLRNPFDIVHKLIQNLLQMADPEKVSKLEELGLGQEDAIAALIKTGNDVEQAIALIFEEPRVVKAADSDQDMQEAIAQSLSIEELNKKEFSGFKAQSTNLTKCADEPLAMEVLKEWPVLGYLLLALAELDELYQVLSEPNHSSVWNTDKSLEESSLAQELLLNFNEQKLSDKKYGSPSSIANYLVSKENVSFPCSVSETMNLIRTILTCESSDEKAAKIKKIISLPLLRESISSTIDYIPVLEMSPFHYDEDLRFWLAKALSAPKTYIFPNDYPQKLLILSFPQLAHTRIPLELYIDRHLKKNAFIMGSKDRELSLKESELYKLESMKQQSSNLSCILESSNFFQKYPNFGSSNLSSRLLEYYSSQISKIKDLDHECNILKRRMSDIFEVPALQKEGLKLFGILRKSPNLCLYLLKSNIWWKFTDQCVEKMDQDFLNSDIDDISCILYKS